MTLLYSLLHMLVDAICALAMFGCFIEEEGYISILLYNFCAFALQMPIGTFLDMLMLRVSEKGNRLPLGFAILGSLLTILGVYTHPVLLGIGNAVFHVGGGVGTIREDHRKKWNGRGLGIFVAPGALGLYLGTIIAKNGSWRNGWILMSIFMVCLSIGAVIYYKKTAHFQLAGQSDIQSRLPQQCRPKQKERLYVLAACCLLVVILRSYIGMAIVMPWKQEPIWAFFSVLAVVGGKMAGGFLAARYGILKSAVVTLLIAAVSYSGLQWTAMGLLALFFFNMTMPMTLYMLIKAIPQLAGFSFGTLTFGLFLGFLLVYFEMSLPMTNELLGCVGSLISLTLLVIGLWKGGAYEAISD